MVTLITRRLQTGADLALARSFGRVDLGFWDGHNMQHQRGPARYGSTAVRPAPVSMLRAIAAELPSVAARLHAARQATCALETEQAGEALAAL
jgi:hypothetical protein